MKNRYKTVIIGSGPAGLFCAYGLIKGGYDDVLLIDLGVSFEDKSCQLISEGFCEDCKTCSILSGAGGSAFYNSGKLSLYPAGSNLSKILGSESKCIEIYDEVISIFNQYGINLMSDDIFDTFENLSKQASSADIKLKYYQSFPINKESFNVFFNRFFAKIQGNVDIEYDCVVEDIEANGNQYYTLKMNRGNGESLNTTTENIVIAVGEAGARWWKKIQKKMRVKHQKSSIDIGIRIEFSSDVLDRIWKMHKDVKLITCAPDGSELRTYCAIKNNRTVICNYGDYKVLDGIEFDESSSGGITLFNRISYENQECMIDYAFYILEKVKKELDIPIYTSMGCFLKKDDNVVSDIIKTLHYSDESNFEKILPKPILDNLRFFIAKIDKIIPGIAATNNVVYFPLIDKLWNPTDVDDKMRTNLRGLYVCGDATGHLRGIMQACVTGLLCADGLLSSQYYSNKEDTKWKQMK